MGIFPDIVLGLCHSDCIAPEDRVIGTVRSDFFEQYPTLVNFDPNKWFASSYGGQAAFNGAKKIKEDGAIMLWAGRPSKALKESYMVELLLENGDYELATTRKKVDKYSKSEAEELANSYNHEISKSSHHNPLGYTEQSRAFGDRKTLMKNTGGTECFIQIEKAVARPYDEQLASKYAFEGSWYAPVAFLRDLDTEEIFSLHGVIVVLTNPLNLSNYIENWERAGCTVPRYEVVSLLSDSEFDDFMQHAEEGGRSVIVDPILDLNDPSQILSGIPLYSQKLFLEAAKEHSKKEG